MIILRSILELRVWRASIPADKAVGFVPTMGALHAGHMKLVDECRRACDVAVVSIFVNPLQFGPNEDLARYPRPFENDAALCREAGVDAIFAPEVADFYDQGHSTYVDVEGLDRFLCGAARPGHFRGVCTVVLKLFNLVKPQRAYFGQKDIQQFLILDKMVADLSLDLEMIPVETVREDSGDAAGLALSSRNAYLGPEQKLAATALYRGLRRAREAHAAGERNAETLRGLARAEIESSHPTRIDYVELVSRARLEPLATLDGPAVLAVAVFYGTTRLIDNVLL
jgi:pantoate--beta-alanine ligase